MTARGGLEPLAELLAGLARVGGGILEIVGPAYRVDEEGA